MIPQAAIYARRSTSQDDRAEDAKSVVRQVENARAFALARGWTVADEHVFVDDGISGAEFGAKRPGLQRLRAAAQRGAFGVLVISELKSLGREAFETNYLVKTLEQQDVEVWGYLDKRCLTPRNAMDKAMSSMRASMDEAGREDATKRGHETHAGKHRRGHVVGGRVFGYRNVDVYAGEDVHGRPLRSHVERVVDEAEAAVVRRIFALFAEGYGLKKIAKQLTAEGAVAPKPFLRKDAFGLPSVGAWVPSTVRAVLRREDYRGVYVWNRTRKRDAWGAVKQRARPASEWQRTPMPAWRVVSDELWQEVATRIKEIEARAVRWADGRLAGRPPRRAVTNLLAGLASCGVCGGGLVVETYTQAKHKPRVPHYVCARRRANGKCANALRIPRDDMHEAVLQAIEAHALTPEAVEQVVRLSERDDLTDRKQTLDRERTDLERRIRNLLAAIESGTDTPAALTARLQELQDRLSAIMTELLSLRPVPRVAPAVIETRLEEWRRLLRGSVTQGRTVLERVLAGRIIFTPRADGAGYDFAAPTRFDKLFAGIAHTMKVRGFDHAVPGKDWVFVPDDERGAQILSDFERRAALDEDYGLVLDRALNRMKGSSPAGFEPALPA
jgi:site-specific DNA recombinase